MSYRPRPDFDQPTAESIERSRRNLVWIIPLAVLQQGMVLFKHDADRSDQLLTTIAWACVTLTILWMLLGLPLRWLSERDQAILNDERNQAISGDATRWGFAAMAAIGCGMMIARVWIRLDAGQAIYGIVNGALIVATARYTWLNRAESNEDE